MTDNKTTLEVGDIFFQEHYKFLKKLRIVRVTATQGIDNESRRYKRQLESPRLVQIGTSFNSASYKLSNPKLELRYKQQQLAIKMTNLKWNLVDLETLEAIDKILIPTLKTKLNTK